MKTTARAASRALALRQVAKGRRADRTPTPGSERPTLRSCRKSNAPARKGVGQEPTLQTRWPMTTSQARAARQHQAA
eukprot:9702701-Heterocapsa_arctica.AAC.1